MKRRFRVGFYVPLNLKGLLTVGILNMLAHEDTEQDWQEVHVLWQLCKATIAFNIPLITAINLYVDHDINIWWIAIPIMAYVCYRTTKKQKQLEAVQKEYDDIAFMINRNNIRYDQAKTTNEFKEVYETYVQAIKIIEDNMMVEYYDVRDKIKAELPNIESKFRG